MRRRQLRPSSTRGSEDLFGFSSGLPEGFRYQPDLLAVPEAELLAPDLAGLPFKPFDFHGYQANRQVVAYGFRYDYGRREVVEAFQQVLINEYRAGAGIGWHRDKPEFDEVVGVSLLAACTFRFRRKSGEGWDRISLTVEPRSAYLLSGPSRTDWEHSIPPLDRHRYSITYRTLAAARA
jgi:2OG-Fe(II) oxygenase superfamily